MDGEKLVGDSAGICDIKRSIKKLARGDSSVLILGETGTGKELVAELIHMVTSPAGKQYVGNQKTGGGMTFDTKNNVEVVHVQKPVVGTWRIEVVGSNVPQGPQLCARLHRAPRRIDEQKRPSSLRGAFTAMAASAIVGAWLRNTTIISPKSHSRFHP